jgi:integrase
VRVIGKPPSVEMTFRELVERWETAVVPTLQPTSADFYKRKLRSHAVPVFGERTISAIGRFDIESFLAEQVKMYCRNTIRGMRASISLVFSWAVACGWLEKNPCSGVKLPQAGQKVVRTVLQPEQVLAIAEKLEEPYTTLILFLAVTGLRISEAVGIRWEDFDGDILHVCRRVYEGKTGQPKTKNSDRCLPIPAPLLERMRALGNAGWVFQSKAGTPVNPGNALKRYV